jgi:hypothetical protein
VLGVVALLTVATAKAEAADVLYQQLPGVNSNQGAISSTLDAFGVTPGYRVADSFVLSAPNARIDAVQWWGQNSPEHPGGGSSFTFTFYADNGGVPGAILDSSGGSLSTTTVNVGSSFGPVTLYSSNLTSPFRTTAGTTYWLSIFNQAANASWEWLSADNFGDGSLQGANPGPPWGVIGWGDMAFQLERGRIGMPEPASLGLLAGGLVGLLVLGRRRLLY